MKNINKSVLFFVVLPIVYLFLTYGLYLFGPIVYPKTNFYISNFYVLGYYLLFIVGMMVAARKIKNESYVRKGFEPFVSKYLNKIIWGLLIVSLVLAYVSCARIVGTLNPIEILNDIRISASNPGKAYFRNLKLENHKLIGGGIFTSLQTLLSSITLMTVPMTLFYIKRVSNLQKLILFLVIFLEISAYVVRGTNIGILRSVLFVVVPAIVNVMGNTSHKKNRRPVLIFSIAAIVLFMFVFSTMITDRIKTQYAKKGISTVTVPEKLFGHEIDENHIFIKNNKHLAIPIVSSINYITQGYHGFDLTFNYDFTSSYGLGFSEFVRNNVEKILRNEASIVTYQDKMDDVWSQKVNWHTIFTWFANDVSQIGVLPIMFLLGFLYFKVVKKSIIEKSLIAYALLPLYCLMILFFPANNVVLSNPLLFMPFAFFHLLWFVEERYLRMNVNQIPRYFFMVKGYAPDNSPTGSLIKNLVDTAYQTANQKYEVVVITRKLNRKVSDVDFGYNVLRVNDKNGMLIHYCQEKLKAENKIIKTAFKYLYLGIRSINFIKRKIIIFPTYNYWTRKYWNLIEEHYQIQPDDIFVGCYFEETFAADKIAYQSDATFVPIYLEMFPRDKTWINQDYVVKKTIKNRVIDLKEKDLLNHAKKIISLPLMSRWLRTQPIDVNKIIDIEHPMIRDCISKEPIIENRFVYTGGLDRTIRNPKQMIEIFEKYQEKYHSDIQLDIYSYGNMDLYLQTYAKEHSLWFHHYGKISPEEAMYQLSISDILVSVGNNTSTLWPSKIYDYISTGRPIIHFYFLEDDPYLDELKNYPLKLFIKLDDDLNINIDKISQFVKQMKKSELSFEVIKQQYSKYLPDYIWNKINKSL